MGRPLRILHSVVNMNRGGAETLLMNLYRNIDRTKIKFDFLTNKEGVFDPEIEQLGGRVYRIPYITDVGHFGYIKALDRFFKDHQQYKVVHSHMDKMSGFVLRAAKRAGVPMRIAHSHNTSSEGGAFARLYKWYAGTRISSNASHLFSCSREAAKWLFHSQAAHSAILKNGIESERFLFSPDVRLQVRRDLGLTEDHFVLGHVGRFNRQKNHRFLIEMFAELQKVKKDARLILTGDGPLRPEIEQQVKDFGLDERVTFLGVRSDIDRLMQAFDVFAFPSFHEGLPVTLIEAQGAGLPCVLSDTITKEVDLGMQLVHYCPLGDMTSWLEKILESSNASRKSSAKALFRNGYDISDTAVWLGDFYLGV
ncbi:glycosyl transferase family 1 [Ammoniphilus oxalaticus]|uniref:Glycosyl transferase family 1 n=1 Tax=Ammoniphilus oxalaticus TaxID=66863 RepID=A0A419SHF3_9BACL|nr:glycosyltransferase family 1 protein [Ammoniphilus oxalaticus]RKD23165.1 glycosyl transferase family 1 [Ammoniphilus oxalaticus]